MMMVNLRAARHRRVVADAQTVGLYDAFALRMSVESAPLSIYLHGGIKRLIGRMQPIRRAISAGVMKMKPKDIAVLDVR